MSQSDAPGHRAVEPGSTIEPPSDPFSAITLPDGDDPLSKGIITDLCSSDGTTTVRVDINGLAASLAERVVEQVRGAALCLPGSDHVRVLPDQGGKESIELPTVDHVIAVASTKGGVGKTTVAVCLARALADRGLRVGLFDADIYGPNVPQVLDIEGPVLSNGDGQPVPIDADGMQVLSPGIVSGTAPTVRRGAIAYGAVETLLGQGAWEDRDVVIVDMPAGTDDVAGAVLEHLPIDGAVFVSTPFDTSLDDTSRTIELFERQGVNAVAGVMNMTQYRCPCCGEASELFQNPGSLAVPIVHELPFNPELQRDPTADLAGFVAVAATVEEYLTSLEEYPADAIDLRGLPVPSQVRQLADELAAGFAPFAAVVEHPDRVIADLTHTAGDLIDSIDQSAAGTATLLSITGGESA